MPNEWPVTASPQPKVTVEEIKDYGKKDNYARMQVVMSPTAGTCLQYPRHNLHECHAATVAFMQIIPCTCRQG